MADSFDILVVSPNQDIHAVVSSRLTKFGYRVQLTHDLNEVLNSESLGNPSLCIVDGNMDGQDSAENVLSVIRDQFPDCHNIVAYSGILEIQSEILYRSGARSIFHLNFEEELLINDIFAKIPKDIEDKKLDLSVMTRISLMDFLECETFPFNTYVILPANKKVILYQRKNTALEEDRAKSIKTRNLELFIRKSDMGEYVKFLSDRIADGKSGSELKAYSGTLRKEVQKALNQIFISSNLGREEQAVMLDSMRKVTMGLMEKMGNGNHFLSKLSVFTSEAFSNFHHSTNVGTYSSMFALLAGFNELEDFFLGGLLHDIGHSESKAEFQDNFDQDHDHPYIALNILERKGVELKEEVRCMILHHHECPDGSGFPNKLTKDEIHPYAKICALADFFDMATSLTDGRTRLTPQEALLDFCGDGEFDAHETYDEEFHRPIIESILISEKVVEITEEVPEIESAGPTKSEVVGKVIQSGGPPEPGDIDEDALLREMMSAEDDAA